MSQTEFTIRATLDEADRTAHGLAGLASASLPPERCVDLEIAVTEALSNIVLHGYGRAGGSISVVLAAWDGEVTIEIRDRGRQVPAGLFESAANPADMDPLTESGRGIGLMVTLADRLSYACTPDGNLLTLGFGGPGRAG